MRRCSSSATRNIAEGFGRFSHREFHQFLRIARGSLTEVQDGLVEALDRQFLSKSEFDEMWRLSDRAVAATTGLMRYLRESRDPGFWKDI